MPAYYYNGLPMVAPFTFRSNQDTWFVEKRDKSVDAGKAAAQRWEIDFSVMTDTNEVDTFLSHTVGFTDTFSDFTFPQFPNVYKAWLDHPDRALNSVGNTMDLNGVGVAGATALSVTSVNETFIPKGYFIKFEGANKIYVTTSDTYVSTPGGTSTLNIFPGLVAQVPNGYSVRTRESVRGRMRVDQNNVQGITFDDGVISGINSITLIEDL